MTDPKRPSPSDESAPSQSDIQRMIAPLRRRAEKIRKRHNYEGRLTARLLQALDPLLDSPTPPGAIRRSDDYPTAHLVWQIRCMDVVLGRCHWRYLVHHTNHGRNATAHVLVGNDLAGLQLDPQTGQLQGAQDAEILARWEGPADIAALESLDPYKASRTSALTSVLALIGFGGDVTMLPSRDAARPPRPPRPHRTEPSTRPARPQTGAAGRQPPPPGTDVAAAGHEPLQRATALTLREIKDIAHQRRIPPSQLIALTRQALGLPAEPVTEADAADQAAVILSDRHPRLPHQAAIRLKALVSGSEPHLPVIAGHTQAAAPRTVAQAPGAPASAAPGSPQTGAGHAPGAPTPLVQAA